MDATQNLEVSWQVNGNSAMTAFRIGIYNNDERSTLVFDTGKLRDGCPFYGTLWDGKVQMFSYVFQASRLQSVGFANGNEYKLVITQWWGEGDTDFVTQTSASAFITRAAPSLGLADIPLPLAARVHTFTANYAQEEGDALDWIRWQLAYEGQEEAPFYDTQNIYGTAQLQMTYDGFFTRSSYAVRCMAQTVNGVVADTGWTVFSVSYGTGILSGYLTAKPICKGAGAKITWDKINYIRGKADGAYTITDGIANVPDGTNITWDEVNGEAMAFAAPWSVIWSGRTVKKSPEYVYSPAYDAKLFSITTSEGVWALEYSNQQQRYFASWNGSEVGGIGDLPYNGRYSAVLTPDTVYLCAEISEFEQGLYPSQTLYPGEELYPKADVERTYFKLNFAQFSLPQGTIQSIQIGGVQECDYLQVLIGRAGQSVIHSVYELNDYNAAFDPETMYFAANFDIGLGAGNLDSISDDEITGVSLYRRKGENGTLQHVVDLPLSTSSVMDYSLASQQGPYSWYLFVISETTNVAQSVESNTVNPCDWDWVILACEKMDAGHYILQSEYRFGKNLSSGAISNNNVPGILQNFTRYPTVQMAPANYMSGTLTSLIGIIDYTNGNGYSDTLEQRDAIWELSTTKKKLFLKNRKGDFIQIRIAGAITMTTMDNSREQAQTAAIPWIQIGSADGIAIVRTK